jgi:formylmethanofuran dehydrogenase subunit C
MTGAKQKQPERPDALAFASKFKRYAPENEKAVRKTEVVEDETLKQLKAAWKACNVVSGARTDYLYAKMRETVGMLEYSAKDVENISLVLAEFQNEERFSEEAGIFLSALIDGGREDAFVIHASHFAEPVRFIAYENKKKVTVKGDTGSLLGGHMQDGSIILEGNADKYVGYHMTGGSITVEGDADENAGDSMAGGYITIKGNAGSSVGNRMTGGSIIVEGDAGNDVGNGMADGIITVNGNVGHWVGMSMKAGSITVNGDAGDDIGLCMNGGIITVKGNAGSDVGEHMELGEIHLGGDYSSIGYNITEGYIFHKDRMARGPFLERVWDYIKNIFKWD